MKQFFLAIGLLLSVVSYSQDAVKVDFMPGAKEIDFSDLWTIDSILIENGRMIERKQPLGFIGDDYQRINVRFISVIRNPENGLEYFVFGKTRVKNNVCDFQGKIIITSSGMYRESVLTPLKQGYISGEYLFYEDKDQPHTGVFAGKFTSGFYFDAGKTLQYDALAWESDEYKNNQFEGTWTNYLTKERRKCNWGDYRIPDSRELDNGAAEFGPASRYEDKGWKSYSVAQGSSLNNTETEKARKAETEQWWK